MSFIRTRCTVPYELSDVIDLNTYRRRSIILDIIFLQKNCIYPRRLKEKSSVTSVVSYSCSESALNVTDLMWRVRFIYFFEVTWSVYIPLYIQSLCELFYRLQQVIFCHKCNLSHLHKHIYICLFLFDEFSALDLEMYIYRTSDNSTAWVTTVLVKVLIDNIGNDRQSMYV